MIVRETAKAKINLDLRVCRRRDDGYHDLDSLVVFSDLGDELILEPSNKFMLKLEGPFADDLGHDHDNLVCQAAHKLASSLGRQLNVAITLVKKLPVSAGIGGGSADAAATMRGLVRLWDVPMTIGDLMPIGKTLGADIAVCLGSRPAQMTGTGDCLAPIDLSEPLSMLLANPGTALPTPDVFKALTTMTGERPSDDKHSFGDSLRSSVNDLEAPAMSIAPPIRRVLKAIANEPDCQLARMSGSGATCFGLYRSREALQQAATSLKSRHPDWWIEATVCR